MVYIGEKDRVIARAVNPLRDAGSEWRDAHARIADQQVLSVRLNDNTTLVTCGAKTTLLSAVVASPARVRLARDAGLAAGENEKLQVVAGLHADMETLAALRELGMPLSLIVFKGIALAGRSSIMQQLLPEEQCPRSHSVSRYVARRGSIINWFIAKNQTGLDDDTCARAAVPSQLVGPLFVEAWSWHSTQGFASTAASDNSIEYERWLQHKQCVEPDVSVMALATSAGHIAVCEDLRSIGCAWNSDVCSHAAVRDRLGTLRWLRNHGCPWDVFEVCIGAACSGSTDILDYVTEQGEVLDADLLTVALGLADRCKEPRAVEWLRQHGAQ
jgi:hypothetical protein